MDNFSVLSSRHKWKVADGGGSSEQTICSPKNLVAWSSINEQAAVVGARGRATGVNSGIHEWSGRDHIGGAWSDLGRAALLHTVLASTEALSLMRAELYG